MKIVVIYTGIEILFVNFQAMIQSIEYIPVSKLGSFIQCFVL